MSLKDTLPGAFGCHSATFSPEEVADIFEVPVDQVRVWIADGVLPARTMLGMTRIDHATVRKVAQAQLVADLFEVDGTREEFLDVGNRYFQ